MQYWWIHLFLGSKQKRYHTFYIHAYINTKTEGKDYRPHKNGKSVNSSWLGYLWKQAFVQVCFAGKQLCLCKAGVIQCTFKFANVRSFSTLLTRQSNLASWAIVQIQICLKVGRTSALHHLTACWHFIIVLPQSLIFRIFLMLSLVDTLQLCLWLIYSLQLWPKIILEGDDVWCWVLDTKWQRLAEFAFSTQKKLFMLSLCISPWVLPSKYWAHG